MPIDLAQPALGYVLAVELSWDSALQVRRYCRADHDLTIAANLYTAVPAIEFSHDPQHGGARDAGAELVMPVGTDPLDKMIVSPFAEVKVTVQEVDIDDLGNPRCVYVGTIAKTTARFRGKADLVSAKLEGVKASMADVSLGIKATDRCPWIFGDKNCLFNLPGATTTATVDLIAGETITLDVLANDDAGGGNGRYTRGYVEFEGLRLLIRQHLIGLRQLRLAEAPPQQTNYTWLNKVVTIAPGCNKNIPDCVFWGQQGQFAGVGRVMPAYNPIIEDTT